MVFADVYLNYRYKLGRQEGLLEGRAEGHEQGLDKGREQGLEEGREEGIELGSRRERARWERYLDELQEARMTGKPEPERPAPHPSR